MTTKGKVIDRDRGWDAIMRGVRKSDRYYVAVGVLDDGSARDDGESNALLASVHEFGAPSQGIPERSFLRSTLDEKQGLYRRLAKELGSRVAARTMRIQDALGLFGTRVVADVKRKIQGGVPPPLKQSTIDRKKSSKPLIDTGQMINAIRHEVRSK